ncbi:unnamed protein product [Adineta steineri]|uniref:Uncharacterized protein n=1 Tax=Adineta steineri TaxID=433720 RepID=A0A819NWH6_9BILA|nr:unnamed protein product [Adineta steineri]CAF4004711.1 unnamed protein product [Adineta steineri]
MTEQLRYKLEQPRDFSNTSLYFTDLTTAPKNHHSHRNNHKQLNADSTFPPMVINLNAAQKEGHSYETAQEKSLIIPHINRPRINENHYLPEFNKDSTNAMIINEKNRRLENKRQYRPSECCRFHRSSKCCRSRRISPTTSLDDICCCCCFTHIGPSTLNSNEDGCYECGDCCTTDSCDCSGCDCGSCDCGGCDCVSCVGGACHGCVVILECCLLCFSACDN